MITRPPPSREQGSGKNTIALAGLERLARDGSGGDFPCHEKGTRHSIVPHHITIHLGTVPGWIKGICHDILRQHQPMGFCQRHREGRPGLNHFRDDPAGFS
jgi:hypothetical protein